MSMLKRIVIVSCFFLLVVSSIQPVFAASTPSYEAALNAYYKGKLTTSLRLLKKLPVSDPKVKFLTGLIHVDRKEYAKADQQLKHLSGSLWENGLLLAYLQLQTALAQDRVDEASQRLRAIRQSMDSSFLVKKSLIAFSKYYYHRDDFKEAKYYLNRVFQHVPDQVIYPKALRLRVYISLAEQNQDDALRYYGKLIRDYPERDASFSLWSKIARSFRYRLSVLDCFENYSDKMTFLQSLFHNRLYASVIKYANQIRIDMEDPYYRHKVDMVLAKAYYRIYNVPECIRVLKDLLQ